MDMYKFSVYCQTIFQRACTSFQSDKQTASCSIFLPMFGIFHHSQFFCSYSLIVTLICIFLIAREEGHLYIYLLIICVSSYVSVSLNFHLFLSGYPCSLFICSNSFHILDMSFLAVVYVTSYFSILCLG